MRGSFITLKTLRAASKINQADLSKLIGISAESYYRKEKGITEFKLNEIEKIVNIFKLSTEQIFFTDFDDLPKDLIIKVNTDEIKN